jgi:hypothetical protein
MGYFVKNRRIESGSTGVVIPTGSAAQRPDYPVFGMIRYNTDLGFCEFYNGSIWQTFGTGGIVNYTVNNFTGDGTTAIFGPLSRTYAVGEEAQIIVFVGSIYQIPSTNYTTDGTAYITFTSTPPDTIPINVIETDN